MNDGVLLSLLGFAIAASVTPGPNVLMVAASAATRGLRATLPLMIGITLGFTLMLLAVGLGLAAPFAASPKLHTAMRWVGAAWLLLLAWRIAQAGGVGADSATAGKAGDRPPLGLLGGAAFQWVNPKAWLVGLAAISTFTSPGAAQGMAGQAATIALVFGLVSMPCLLVWAGIGAGTGRLLRGRPAALRAFNIAMAVLLALSVLPLLWPAGGE